MYASFEALMTPESVCAVTTNPLFGQFWRAVCKDRGDPERRQKLLDSLSSLVSKLPDADKETVKAFVEQSYDQTDAIMEKIKACTSNVRYATLRAGPRAGLPIEFGAGLFVASSRIIKIPPCHSMFVASSRIIKFTTHEKQILRRPARESHPTA